MAPNALRMQSPPNAAVVRCVSCFLDVDCSEPERLVPLGGFLSEMLEFCTSDQSWSSLICSLLGQMTRRPELVVDVLRKRDWRVCT